MSSTGPKHTISLDDDLLLDSKNPKKASDDCLPLAGLEARQLKIDPGTLTRSPLLTVSDIVNYNREGIDETDQIRRLEKRQSDQDAMNEMLLHRIPDNFLDNLEHNDDDRNGKLGADDYRPGLQGTDAILPELTVQYDNLSVHNQNQNSEQDGKLEANDSRNPGLQGTGTTRTNGTNSTNGTTLSELTRQFARLSANHDVSMQSFTTDDSIARGMADRYYQNAAKMIPEDIELGRDEVDESSQNSDASRKKKFLNVLRVKRRIAANLEIFKEFLEPHKERLRKSFKKITIYIMLPSLVMAIFLFYVFENPPTGYALAPCYHTPIGRPNRELQTSFEATTTPKLDPIPIGNSTDEQKALSQIAGESITPSPSHSPTMFPSYSPTISPSLSPTVFPRKLEYTLSDRKNLELCIDEALSIEEASASWWFLFIGIRQVITFCLAVLIEIIVIDFCMFRTRLFPRLVGTELALAVGQSKGWPCILFFWAIIDRLLLFGKSSFARHWIFYQNFFSLMNETNPSGGVPGHARYHRIIYFAIGLSVAATLKRTMMANFVGQRVVENYRLDLTNLIKNLVIIGDVANLSKARQSSRESILFQRMSSLGREVIGGLGDKSKFGTEDDDEGDLTAGDAYPINSPPSIRTRSPINDRGSSIFITQIYEYLDEWEEPELQSNNKKVSTKDVLHFRRAIEFINGEYPFSSVFGRAATREECARASQKLFEKLLESDEEVLNFDFLCKVTKNRDGTNNNKKVLELIKLFRPDRNGDITKLEFVKSIDSVYKKLRLVLVNINSSSQIDRAYGQLMNAIFCATSVMIGFSVLGFNVENLLITLAGLFFSFAFMIGSASSKYVEGILLILVRRPYDIGDKVCFMDANADVDDFGPPGGGWIVENVNLYTTTVRKGTTREYATFTNGSLANSRILNLKRSEKPNIYMYLKFTMNITQEQLDEFRRRIIKFIKDRPREWIKLVSLRCTHFETEQQYLTFALIVQHRESWQSFGTIQVSKSGIYVHALHLQKELKMDYTAPKLPVHLTGVQSKTLVRDFFDSDTDENIAATNESPSRSLLHNYTFDNKSKARGVLHDSSDSGQSELTGVFTTTINAGAKSAIDGSLVRRKGGRIDNSGSRDLFEDDANGQPMNAVEESIRRKGGPGVSSPTISRLENVNRRQVSFATEEQREREKNKDT